MRTSGLGPRRHWLLHAAVAAEKPGRDNDVEAGLARALAFHRGVGATAYVRDARLSLLRKLLETFSRLIGPT